MKGSCSPGYQCPKPVSGHQLYQPTPTTMSLFSGTYTRLCGIWPGILPATTAIFVLYVCARGLVCIRGLAAAVASGLAAPSAGPPSLPRGRRTALSHSPRPTPFEPRAHQHQSDWIGTVLRVLSVLDEVVVPAVETTMSSIGAFSLLMEKVKRVFSVPDIKAYVTPLKTRVQRGIAQVTTLPGAFTQHNIQYRYLCPTSFLLVLTVALVLGVGVSIKLACLTCSGGCLVVVAGGNMGAEEESEGRDLGPEMADTRLIAALLERT
jgi:hypothetical protein